MKLKLFLIIIVVLALCGCTTMKQSAEFKLGDTDVKLVNTKTSVLYWSKYQATVDNYGLTTKVYNAEGAPDPNAVEAALKGVVEALLMIK